MNDNTKGSLVAHRVPFSPHKTTYVHALFVRGAGWDIAENEAYKSTLQVPSSHTNQPLCHGHVSPMCMLLKSQGSHKYGWWLPTSRTNRFLSATAMS